MEIFSKFGVQPILLLAQIINFLILLILLRRFLYTPLLKMLETRKHKIEEGLKNAEEIERRLKLTEEEKEKVLKKAFDEVKKILQDATRAADQIIQEAHAKAQKDTEVMIKRAQGQLSQERENLNREMRAELAKVVTISLEKIMGKIVTSQDQKDLIKDTVRHLS